MISGGRDRRESCVLLSTGSHANLVGRLAIIDGLEALGFHAGYLASTKYARLQQGKLHMKRGDEYTIRFFSLPPRLAPVEEVRNVTNEVVMVWRAKFLGRGPLYKRPPVRRCCPSPTDSQHASKYVFRCILSKGLDRAWPYPPCPVPEHTWPVGRLGNRSRPSYRKQ